MPGSLKRCVLVEAKARGERQIFLLERCILTTDANLKKPSHPLDPASRLQSSFQAQSVQVRMSGPEVRFGSDAFWHSWETTWSPAGYLGAT